MTNRHLNETGEINNELYLETILPPRELFPYLGEQRPRGEAAAWVVVNHSALIWKCWTKRRAAFVKSRKAVGGSY